MKKSFLFMAVVSLAAVFVSCKDKVEPQDPTVKVTVTTTAVSDISGATAKSGGTVSSDGIPTISSRGVCWSTSQNPTTASSKTTDGTGLGQFTSSMTGLEAGVLYYVRAYAVYGSETVYGNQVSFTAGLNPPMVTTAEITDINITTATGGGKVTDEGDKSVIEAGLCWSTSQNPTTEDANTVEDLGTDGSFTSELIYLTPNTTYYVRAYATSEAGTGYGSQVSFTTRPESVITISDAGFKAYLVQNFDTNGDGVIQESEALRVISIDLQAVGNVASIEGIKSFVNLKELRVNTDLDVTDETQRNAVATVDVSGLDQLEVLWCFNSKVSSVNVSGCTSLRFLHAYVNSLTTLDIRDCGELEELDIRDNPVTAVDFINNRKLRTASLIRTRIKNVDLSGVTTLQNVWCDGGIVETVNVSGCTALKELFCQDQTGATLTSLNITGCTGLTKLWAFNNKLSAFNASGLGELTEVNISGNVIENIDLSGCSKLTFLNGNVNKFTSLDLSQCTALEEMHVNETSLLSISFTNNVNIKKLGLINTQIETIDLSGKTTLTGLWCDGNQKVTSVNVSGCSSLALLYAQWNPKLATLNVTGCTSLTTLWTDTDPLLQSITGLNTLAALDYWQTYASGLTSVDLSGCLNLRDLRIQDGNPLTSITVYSPMLVELHTQRNTGLVSIDVSRCPLLDIIWGYNCSSLSSLDVSKCAFSMRVLNLNECTALQTLTMKNGQTATEYVVPGTTIVNRVN